MSADRHPARPGLFHSRAAFLRGQHAPDDVRPAGATVQFVGRAGPGDPAPRPADFVPARGEGVDAAVVRLLRRPPEGEPPAALRPVWEHDAGCAATAAALFAWMRSRPGEWDRWGWLAHALGGAALDIMVVAEAERDAQRLRDERALERARAERRRRVAKQVDLFVHDPRGGRPALFLRSADQEEAFWTMTFSERWERERVLDRMRQQKPRFLEWRDLVARDGPATLDRLVMAGMRETELELKARGLTHPGRRPLRFWRGE